MAKVDLKDVSGRTVGSIELDDSIFAQDVNEHLLWEVVKWQRAKARSGTAMTKTRGEVRGSIWVDDYGHHPTEIEAAIQAMRDTYGRRIVAVFQPHRFTRTRALRDRFLTCFTGVSELVLLPIYPAGETPIPGVSSESLIEGIKANGTTSVRMAADFGQAAKIARDLLRPGDLLVTIGAGDVYRVGELLGGGPPVGAAGPATGGHA